MTALLHEMPKEDRLLLVLDTDFSLWDLLIDTFAAYDTVENIIVTDTFLRLLSATQIRDILLGISNLKELRIVQIDFPPELQEQYHQQQQQRRQQKLDASSSLTGLDAGSSSRSSITSCIMDENLETILEGILYLLKRAKGLTSIRFNNLDIIKKKSSFRKACVKHPSLKNIEVLGGEEGLKASYRSTFRSSGNIISKKQQLGELKTEQQQQQQQQQQQKARRNSLTGNRHERGRHRDNAVDTVTEQPVGYEPTAQDHAEVRRRLLLAISKKDKQRDEDGRQIKHEHDHDNSIRDLKRNRHHARIGRTISRSVSPERQSTLEHSGNHSSSSHHAHKRHHHHHRHNNKRRAHSENPTRESLSPIREPLADADTNQKEVGDHTKQLYDDEHHRHRHHEHHRHHDHKHHHYRKNSSLNQGKGEGGRRISKHHSGGRMKHRRESTSLSPSPIHRNEPFYSPVAVIRGRDRQRNREYQVEYQRRVSLSPNVLRLRTEVPQGSDSKYLSSDVEVH